MIAELARSAALVPVLVLDVGVAIPTVDLAAATCALGAAIALGLAALTPRRR